MSDTTAIDVPSVQRLIACPNQPHPDEQDRVRAIRIRFGFDRLSGRSCEGSHAPAGPMDSEYSRQHLSGRPFARWKPRPRRAVTPRQLRPFEVTQAHHG